MKNAILLLLLFLAACNGSQIKPTHYDDIVLIMIDPRYPGSEDREPFVMGEAVSERYTPEQARMLLEVILQKQGYLRVGEITAALPQRDHDCRTLVLGHELDHVMRGDTHGDNRSIAPCGR